MLKNKSQKLFKKEQRLINYSAKEQNLINCFKNIKWIFIFIILGTIPYIIFCEICKIEEYEYLTSFKDLILLFAGLLFSVSASFIFGYINDYRNLNYELDKDYQKFKDETEKIFLHNQKYVNGLSNIVVNFYCEYYDYKNYNSEKEREKLLLEYKYKIINYQHNNCIITYDNICNNCYFYNNNNQIHYFINKIDFKYKTFFNINLENIEKPNEILQEIKKYYSNNIGIEIRTLYNSKELYSDPWTYYIKDFSVHEDKIFYYYDKKNYIIHNEIQNALISFYPYSKIKPMLLKTIYEYNDINKQKYNPVIDELIPELKGKFDTAKMINPDINGVDYQHGQTYGFFDERYFVFARDNYTCQVCGKSKDKILQTHHIIYRSNGGTDRVNNLITVCTDCHTSTNHKKGGILYKWQEEHKKVKQYKEPPFMNILRKRIFIKYPDAIITYGSETTPKRKDIGLEKTHYNDAIIISGIETIKKNTNEWLLIKQFRKKKRSLHEATARKGRKEPNRTQKRNSKNTPYYKKFWLNDKVSVLGQVGYITGFTSGGAYIKNADDEYITLPGKSYKQVSIANLQLISHNNNWQYINNAV